MSKRICCIIPSYNHAKYIPEAIRSVLRQTFPPHRLVIIDDGSQDNSVDVVRTFNDPRIHLVEQKNQGAHVALTRGIELSKDCDFISVLNSDDRYHPERFARCAAYLEGYPGAELVCSRIRLINESGVPVGRLDGRQRRMNRIWSNLSKIGDPVSSLGYSNFTKTTSNFFFRRGAIAAFRPYRFVHDYFAALIVALRGSLGLIQQELLDYRVHGANTIKAEGKGAVVQEVIQMHLDLLAELRPSLETDPLLRKRVLNYLKVVLNNYTDMRAELLVLSIARLLTEEPYPTEKLREFPEIGEPSTPPP
ncbi:MAG: glycosyltransferase [Verrucomicrobia bacterium]|jgi:glycosyltransferase involved in cell wall biosynthesis|nr:glycosyltransferase [Verrucomicrobiota bacterium]